MLEVFCVRKTGTGWKRRQEITSKFEAIPGHVASQAMQWCPGKCFLLAEQSYPMLSYHYENEFNLYVSKFGKGNSWAETSGFWWGFGNSKSSTSFTWARLNFPIFLKTLKIHRQFTKNPMDLPSCIPPAISTQVRTHCWTSKPANSVDNQLGIPCHGSKQKSYHFMKSAFWIILTDGLQ